MNMIQKVMQKKSGEQLIGKKYITLALAIMTVMIFANQTGVLAAEKKVVHKTSKVTMNVGKTRKLKTPKAKKIRWKSSKKAVVTVSKKGKIRGRKAGKATVTAWYVKNGKQHIKRWRIIVKAKNRTTTNASQTTEQINGNAESTYTQTAENNTILVAYFSWSGTSEKIAKEISEQTGGDLF